MFCANQSQSIKMDRSVKVNSIHQTINPVSGPVSGARLTMSAEQFPPDNAFLLACLTLGPDDTFEKFAQAPLNWDNILQLALTHGVASLVDARLKIRQSDAIPNHVMQE